METAANPWQMGVNLALNAAQGGAFGSSVAKVTNKVINPVNTLAKPPAAPVPPPVAGQQSVNPPAQTGGIAAHFRAHWGKYAIGAVVLVVLVAGVKLARR